MEMSQITGISYQNYVKAIDAEHDFDRNGDICRRCGKPWAELSRQAAINGVMDRCEDFRNQKVQRFLSSGEDTLIFTDEPMT